MMIYVQWHFSHVQNYLKCNGVHYGQHSNYLEKIRITFKNNLNINYGKKHLVATKCKIKCAWWPLNGFFLGTQPTSGPLGHFFPKQFTPNGHQLEFYFGDWMHLLATVLNLHLAIIGFVFPTSNFEDYK
jgi:hypothetical protein